jgi:DNA-directed RNA polymerase sigma subunit (sigma70/sigma32)
MNLKDGRGKVPVKNSTQNEATPYLLLDFPTREEFNALYAKHKSIALKDQYWQILNHRSQGHTLAESGQPFGITRERVRQIEARFQRLVGESYRTQTEAILSMLSAHPLAVASFLSSEIT